MLPREPPTAALPYGTEGLGPVLTLRCYLSEKQCASYKSENPDKPILARFEVIQANDQNIPPSHLFDHKEEPLEYSVRAILYWAYLDSTTGVPGLGLRMRRRQLQPGVRYTWDQPQLQKVRVEVVEYQVTARGVRAKDQDGEETIVVRPTEWTVQDSPHLINSVVVPIVKRNEILPLYDLSALRVDPEAAAALAAATRTAKR